MDDLKKKKKIWSLEDEEYLVELWADKILELRGCRKNGHIFKEMAAAFEGRYTPEEIRVKLHNLTNKYKKEKKLIGPSGGSPSDWSLYSKIHAILGEFRVHNLESIVEDSRPTEPPVSTFGDDDPLNESSTFDGTASGTSSSSPNDSSPTGPSRPKKKKKINNEEDLKVIDKKIESLISQVNDNDKENLKIMKEFVESAKAFHSGVLSFLNK